MTEKASPWLYTIGFMLSLLLSCWIDSQQSVINPDAICYLLSAETIGREGLRASMHLCVQSNWPLYAILIYGLQHILPLSYQTSAYFIDAIFTALSVGLFIRIVQELGASRRILWFALLTILLAHDFNSVRQYIVRDHGYWTLYLASVLLLLQYMRQPRFLLAVLWSLSLMLAALFRIEGAFLLMALPFTVLFTRDVILAQRVKMFFSLQTLTLIIGVILVAWLTLHPQESLQKMGRLTEIKDQLLHGLTVMYDRYHAAKLGMAQHVLNPNSARDAGSLLSIMLLGMYVLYVITNLSIGYACLVVYGWLQQVYKWSARSHLVIVSYAIINIVITLGFLFEQFFLSKRYLIALSLILMLMVPFALNDLLKRMQQGSHRFIGGFVLLLVFISSIGGVMDFGHSKTYMREAGEWMRQHLARSAKTYTNDYQVFYYAQRANLDPTQFFQQYQSMQGANWEEYDYVAIQMNHHTDDQQPKIKNKSLQKLNEFSNKRGDKVIVYQVTDAIDEERVQ
jgi:hypothetical protein